MWELELLEEARESPVNHAALRGCLLAAAALLLVTVGPYRLSPYALRHVERPSGLRAYLYAKEHPGSVYFPSNPVATFLAEGSFYDTEWGVMNRVLSGNVPSPADIWRHVPPWLRPWRIQEVLAEAFSCRSSPRLGFPSRTKRFRILSCSLSNGREGWDDVRARGPWTSTIRLR